MVEWSGFENRRRLIPSVGSNPTPSAKKYEVLIMSETTFETVAIDFLDFIFGVGETLISTFVWFWVVFVLFRYFLKNMVFKDEEASWKRFASTIRIGFEELSDAFLSAMSILSLSAKQLLKEKKEELEW